MLKFCCKRIKITVLALHWFFFLVHSSTFHSLSHSPHPRRNGNKWNGLKFIRRQIGNWVDFYPLRHLMFNCSKEESFFREISDLQIINFYDLQYKWMGRKKKRRELSPQRALCKPNESRRKKSFCKLINPLGSDSRIVEQCLWGWRLLALMFSSAGSMYYAMLASQTHSQMKRLGLNC